MNGINDHSRGLAASEIERGAGKGASSVCAIGLSEADDLAQPIIQRLTLNVTDFALGRHSPGLSTQVAMEILPAGTELPGWHLVSPVG